MILHQFVGLTLKTVVDSFEINFKVDTTPRKVNYLEWNANLVLVLSLVAIVQSDISVIMFRYEYTVLQRVCLQPKKWIIIHFITLVEKN